MVDKYLPQYVKLLAKQYLFQGLDEAGVVQVAKKFKRVEYDANTTVFSQGDPGEEFFVIFEGEVCVTITSRKGVRNWGTLSLGDYFGEEALLFERPRSASVITLQPTVLLCLDREQFFELLDKYPDIRKNLSATAESRYIAHKENFDWLGKDEVIYLITRKHELFLYVSLILPMFTGVISIPFIVFGVAAATPFLHAAGLSVGIGLFIWAILWSIWNWIDWGNDFYIVTNQRVVWLERIIGLYNSRREAPLIMVLAVNVTSSQIGRIFDYGNIDVRTFTGSIFLRNSARPQLFEEYIRSYRERAQTLAKEAEIKSEEEALQNRLASNAGYVQTHGEVKSEQFAGVLSQEVYKPGSLWETLNTFFKVRYERGGVITYRKHWFVLLRKIFWPLLTFLLFLAGTIYIGWNSLSQGISTTSMFSGIGILVVVYLGIFLWWLYQYVDWSNDIYQVTPDQILDIERRPLGKEDKKTAALDSILSLEHTRDGILELALNFGNVTINVGQTKFIFRGVHNPDQVHKDIADYMEARLRKKNEAEALQQRDRMINLLETYHKQRESHDFSDTEPH